MNVIIPLGGIGKRFSDEGFGLPKPLVHYLGEPMIFKMIESLSFDSGDRLFIPYNDSLSEYNFENLLYKRFPNLGIRFKKIKSSIGAVDTIHQMLEEFTDEELEDITISIDGDTYYKEDIIQLCKQNNHSTIFYFKDSQEKPLFSYIQLNENNEVINIKEKVKISDNANSGCFKFSSGRLLNGYCEKMLGGEDIKKELYLSMLYGLMIEEGHKILGYEIKKENIVCVGTPSQLRELSVREPHVQKVTFCFDLDNTLVSYPYKTNDYTTVKPIQKNISFLKNLKKNGHKIIIYTARGMLTYNGDVEKILKDRKESTIQQLKDFDIPYDELIFGKPLANFYIDDAAINFSDSNLEKRTGFHFASDAEEKRDFNKMEFNPSSIKKMSNNISLVGEIYYYQNIPERIRKFFPNFLKTDGESYYEIERIYGLSFSDLYINDLLTINDLKDMLAIIKEIHSIKKDDEIDIYENYAEKVKKRAKIFDYNRFEKNEEIYDYMMKNLEEYKTKNLGVKTVIHGDPVFTNILISKNFEDTIKFIDMRGIQGEKFSIEGDMFYDYAKIYQSIIGYDHILKGKFLNHRKLEEFKSYFEEYFISIYGAEMLRYLRILTLSLVYSLIPYHEEKNRDNFWDLVKRIYGDIKFS